MLKLCSIHNTYTQKRNPALIYPRESFRGEEQRQEVSVPPYHRLHLLPAHRLLPCCWYGTAMVAERPVTAGQTLGGKAMLTVFPPTYQGPALY